MTDNFTENLRKGEQADRLTGYMADRLTVYKAVPFQIFKSSNHQTRQIFKSSNPYHSTH